MLWGGLGTTRPGKHTKNDGKIHHFQWVNPLFLWSFSIAMLNYQRVPNMLLAFSTESSCLTIAKVNLGWVKMDELSWKARPVEPPGTKWDFSCSGFWSIPCVDCANLIISNQMASGFSYQKNLGCYQQIVRIHAIWLVDGFFLFQSLFGMII